MKKFAVYLLGLWVIAGVSHAQEAPRRVFIAADSTAAEYGPERAPQAGWGQVLQSWLDTSKWQVHNHAIGGRSTRSFIDEGRLEVIEKQLHAGDVLLIQFGHNDAKFEDPRRYTDSQGDYPRLLSRYIDVARAKGATPVLITPVARLLYDFGALLDTHGVYTQAMKQLATERNVQLIDLNASSMAWIRALGEQGAKPYFMFVPEQGKADGTHFSVAGATAVACQMMRGWVALQPELKAQLQRDIDCASSAAGQGSASVAPTASHWNSAASTASVLAVQRNSSGTQEVPPPVVAAPSIAARNDASPSPSGSKVIHERDIALTQPGPHGGAGPTTAYPFFAEVADLPFVLRKRVLHKGAGIGLHPQHKDEIYYIVSGQGSYVLDGKQHDVGPGDALLTRTGSRHALQQIGDQDLVLLLAYPR